MYWQIRTNNIICHACVWSDDFTNITHWLQEYIFFVKSLNRKKTSSRARWDRGRPRKATNLEKKKLVYVWPNSRACSIRSFLHSGQLVASHSVYPEESRNLVSSFNMNCRRVFSCYTGMLSGCSSVYIFICGWADTSTIDVTWKSVVWTN